VRASARARQSGEGTDRFDLERQTVPRANRTRSPAERQRARPEARRFRDPSSSASGPRRPNERLDADRVRRGAHRHQNQASPSSIAPASGDGGEAPGPRRKDEDRDQTRRPKAIDCLSKAIELGSLDGRDRAPSRASGKPEHLRDSDPATKLVSYKAAVRRQR